MLVVRWAVKDRDEHTVVGDALEGLLEQLAPVKVQAVEPWRDAAFYECLCIFMSVLLLHLGEAGDAQVGEVLAVGTAMGALV